MRQFYDVSASCAKVCVLFRTYTFVLTSACVNFMMYRLLVLTFAFCFERIRLFLLTKLCVYHTYTSILTRMRCVIQAHASILWCIGFLCWRMCFVSNVYVCFEPTQKYVFWQKCVSNQRIHFRMSVFFIAYTSFLRCMCLSCWRLRCVSNVYVCYVPTHTHIFGQRCVLNKRINHIFHACVDLILRIHHFCDPCAGLAYGCIVILTCTSI